ncbi:MAG: hypothetical protein ABIR70_14345 [Bryobacteraceae bacterium]
MEYVLTNFQQQLNIRRFFFKGTNAAKERLEYIVGVDLSLARKYSIPVQELPLLCVRYLETRTDELQPRGVTFTDRQLADFAAQRDADKKSSDAKRRGHGKAAVAKEEN